MAGKVSNGLDVAEAAARGVSNASSSAFAGSGSAANLVFVRPSAVAGPPNFFDPSAVGAKNLANAVKGAANATGTFLTGANYAVTGGSMLYSLYEGDPAGAAFKALDATLVSVATGFAGAPGLMAAIAFTSQGGTRMAAQVMVKAEIMEGLAAACAAGL